MDTPAIREELHAVWYLISVNMRVGTLALEVDGLKGPEDGDRLAQIEAEAAGIRRYFPDSLRAHPERERAEAEAAGRFRDLTAAVQNARERLGMASPPPLR